MIYDLKNLNNNPQNNFGGLCGKIIFFDWDKLAGTYPWEADLATGKVVVDDLPFFANTGDWTEIEPTTYTAVYREKSSLQDAGNILQHEISISLQGMPQADKVVLNTYIGKRWIVLFKLIDSTSNSYYILGDTFSGCTLANDFDSGANPLNAKNESLLVQWLSQDKALIWEVV